MVGKTGLMSILDFLLAPHPNPTPPLPDVHVCGLYRRGGIVVAAPSMQGCVCVGVCVQTVPQAIFFAFLPVMEIRNLIRDLAILGPFYTYFTTVLKKDI